MKGKVDYDVKELLEMFRFSKYYCYQEKNKGSLPNIQIVNSKSVCGWDIEEQF